jgi:hypothetical protein
LTKETDDINPFVMESLRWHVQIRSLLGAFAEEMSRPLKRDDNKIRYLPCQKLAEFIRENRYDGIRYPSAVCPGGTNVVLFDPDIADVTGARLARITELTLEYEVEETPVHGTHAGESAETASPEEGASS